MKAGINVLMLFTILLFTSCRKDKLPSLTRTGANTMGCRINGEVWLPESSWGLMNASVDYDRGRLSILASNSRSSSIYNQPSITIELENLTGVQKFTCDDSNVIRLNYDKGQFHCTSFSGASGWVEVTRLDTVTQIVSGTFEFWAQCDSTTGVMISEGRFDFNYPYNR